MSRMVDDMDDMLHDYRRIGGAPGVKLGICWCNEGHGGEEMNARW